MKKIALATAAAVALGLSVASNAASTLLDEAEQIRDAKGFSAVELKGSMDVYVTAGSDFSVRVVADDDIIDAITTEVRGETLEISMKRGSWRNIRRQDVYVTLPALEQASLMGSGDMEIKGVKGNRFKLYLRGSGDINLDTGMIKATEVKLQGSGDIDMNGSCETLSVNLQGSGDIDADNFECNDVKADLRGSGDMHVYAKSSADLNLRGSGDIDLSGRPKKVRESTRGSGDITIR